MIPMVGHRLHDRTNIERDVLESWFFQDVDDWYWLSRWVNEGVWWLSQYNGEPGDLDEIEGLMSRFSSNHWYDFEKELPDLDYPEQFQCFRMEMRL